MSRRRTLVAVAVAAALAVAGLTGWYPWAKLTPDRPVVTLHPGQSAELAGVRYRLAGFTVAPTLPAADPKDPAVAGPAGSSLVLVVLTQTVLDRSIVLDEHYCTATLVDDTGTTVWQTDLDVTASVARPAAYGCASTDDAPLRDDEPRDTGFSFVVPTAAVGRLAARLQVTGGPTLTLAP